MPLVMNRDADGTAKVDHAQGTSYAQATRKGPASIPEYAPELDDLRCDLSGRAAAARANGGLADGVRVCCSATLLSVHAQEACVAE